MRNILFMAAAAGLAALAAPALIASRSGDAVVTVPQDAISPAPKPGVELRTAVSTAPSGRKVRIEADPSGHYRTELKFNGRRIEGLIDTGATVVAINTSMARKIGISVASLDFRYEVSTANGKARAAVATIDSVDIGRIRLDKVEAMVLDDRALSGTLIGMSVLKRLSRYQVENQVLLLEQ